MSIHCPARPATSNVAFLGLDTFEDVLRTFKEAKTKLGEILSSCEFIDNASMDAVTTNLNATNPIGKQKFYMLIEASGKKGLRG